MVATAHGDPIRPFVRSVREPGRHNLPQSLTRFIGREREIAEARRLVAAARLLTLTGTGGVGKTRLGHEVAASLLDPSASSGQAFEDGVWLIELAALADPLLVPHAVAAVIGVREEPERTLTASLAAALHPRRALLVLDNCEQLIEACAELADALLRACPGLRILATSRQPLGIAGEAIFRVPSLSLTGGPDAPPSSAAGEEETRQSTGESEAVRLFVERARAAVPGFTLTGRNSPAVEQICRRLDGIPLAIELAAARVTVLTPEQIAARLGDRFRLLTGGSRTSLPRYRTLRALIDWSHDLLDDKEKVVVRRLVVFAGGWTLDAAEAVCAGDGLASDEILDVLSGLVMKSLVLADEHPDEVRYSFLESIREYAGEKLREAGEETRLRDQHRTWFLTLAERAEPELCGPRSVPWFDRLELERENVRAALGWCIERGEAEAGLRLAGALDRFWLVRGPYRETRDMLATLLAVPAAQAASPPIQAARAKVLLATGRLSMRQDDRTAADVYFQEYLAISRQHGDRRGLAIALFSIGHVARVRGHYAAARSRYVECRQVFEALGDDHSLAQTHLELGVTAYYLDDLVTAREHFEASLALYRRLRDDLGITVSLSELGEVALVQREHERAKSLLCASLEMARSIDDKQRIAMTLAALAGLAAAQRRPTRALRLASAAFSLNAATGQRNSPAWHAMIDRWLAPARQALSTEACAAADAAGRAMPLGQAIEYALAADVPAAHEPATAVSAVVEPAAAILVSREPVSHARVSIGPARDVAAPAGRVTNQITQRESEVAALVARGLTNRQIAQALTITEGTAACHVKHILARLVLDSRVQIATWAIEQGLHQTPTPMWGAAH